MKKLLYSFIIIFTFAYVPSLSGMHWFKPNNSALVEELKDKIDTGAELTKAEVENLKDQDLVQLLQHAIIAENINTITAIHDANPQIINTPDNNGYRALHIIASRPPYGETSQIVKQLMVYGADLNATTNDGNTPLHFAELTNNIPVINALMTQLTTANLNAQNFQRQTPLYFAVRAGNIDNTNQLLEHGANPNIPDNRGNTPLHIATTPAMVQLLCTHQAHINVKNSNGDTPLHSAIQQNRENVVAQLLDLGASLTLHNNQRQTPLEFAQEIKNQEVIKQLLQAEKNPTRLLIQAIQDDNEPQAIYAINNNANINAKILDTNRTIIQQAVEWGKFGIILELLQHNVQIDEQLKEKLFLQAIQFNKEALIQFLLDNNITITKEALRLSKDKGNPALYQILFNKQVQQLEAQQEQALLAEKLRIAAEEVIKAQKDPKSWKNPFRDETSGEDISIFPSSSPNINPLENNPPENNPLNQQPNKPWKKSAAVGSGILATILAYVRLYKAINEQKIPMYLNQDELASIIIAALHDKKYKYALDTALANPHACNAIARDCDSSMQKHLEYLIYSEEDNIAALAIEAAYSMNPFTKWIEDTASTKLHYLSLLWHLINQKDIIIGS